VKEGISESLKDLVSTVVKGGVKLDHWGGEKVDHFVGSLRLCFEGFAGSAGA
jgi:hypothetical protein